MKKLVSLLIIVLLGCASYPLKAQEPAEILTGEINGHQYVDMGLPSGTLWAATNIGATENSSRGDFFAWGEVEPKISFFEENYKFVYGKTTEKMLKSSNVHVIKTFFDAASTQWGEEWETPSTSQFSELLHVCKHYTTKIDDVPGMLFISPNGNTLFFPYHGGKYKNESKEDGTTGYFWTRESEILKGKRNGNFYAFHTNPIEHVQHAPGFYGMNVRPVLSRNKTYYQLKLINEDTTASLYGNDYQNYVDLGLPSKTLWATANLEADNPSEIGGLYVWGGRENVAEVSQYQIPYLYKKAASNEASGKDSFTKYVTYKMYGKTDFKETLDKEDDAASCLLGPDWCIPSPKQWEELFKECTVTPFVYLGSEGLLFKGKNDAVLFIPNVPFILYTDSYGVKQQSSYFKPFYYHTNKNNSVYTSAFELKMASSTARVHQMDRGCALCIRPVRVRENRVKEETITVSGYITTTTYSGGGRYEQIKKYTIECSQLMAKYEILDVNGKVLKTKSFNKGSQKATFTLKPIMKKIRIQTTSGRTIIKSINSK